jgi:hypothetical protein
LQKEWSSVQKFARKGSSVAKAVLDYPTGGKVLHFLAGQGVKEAIRGSRIMKGSDRSENMEDSNHAGRTKINQGKKFKDGKKGEDQDRQRNLSKA